MLGCLEKLAQADVHCVRKVAIAGIIKVGADLPADCCDDVLGSMVHNLSSAVWYNHRISAAAICAFAYKMCTPSFRPRLLQDFQGLAKDTMQIVRRMAAQELGALATEVTAVGDHDHAQFCLEWFKTFKKDDQDNIRMWNVGNGGAITAMAAALLPAEIPALQELLIAACTDPSWRVRLCTVEAFAAWATAFGDHLDLDVATDHVVALMGDSEPEVRARAAASFRGIAQALLPRVTRLVPCLNQLMDDKSDHVKESTAAVVCGLAGMDGISPHQAVLMIKPVALHLLHDESPKVRLAVLRSVATLVDKTSDDDRLDHQLMDAVGQLSTVKEWHVRDELARLAPELVELFVDSSRPQQLAFNGTMAQVLLNNLSDPVAAVRVTSCDSLVYLIKLFGDAWTQKTVLPRLQQLSKHIKYLYRITALVCIARFGPHVSPDALATKVLPIVTGMANDKVPNVRLNVAKTLGLLAENVESSVVAQIRPVLRELQSDPGHGDVDVQQAARAALRGL